MPLNNVAYVNPFDGASSSEGWAYCSRSDFNWSSKTLRLRYAIYVSKAAADAGLPPVKQYDYFLDAEAFLPMLAANAVEYGGLAAVLDGFAASKVEFSGASVEPAVVSPQ